MDALLNIQDQFKPIVYCRRNSDPEEYREEQIDGRLIWPKCIDPWTNRPVVQLLRSEFGQEPEDAHFAPRLDTNRIG